MPDAEMLERADDRVRPVDGAAHRWRRPGPSLRGTTDSIPLFRTRYLRLLAAPLRIADHTEAERARAGSEPGIVCQEGVHSDALDIAQKQRGREVRGVERRHGLGVRVADTAPDHVREGQQLDGGESLLELRPARGEDTACPAPP